MRHVLLAAVLFMLATTRLPAAETGNDGCCVKTYVNPPIHIFPQPPSPPPVHAKPGHLPPIKLFTIEDTPPKFKEGPPPPPIKIVQLPPPPVKVFTICPPVPKLFRFEQSPPKMFEIKPPPPITVYHLEHKPPGPAPTLKVPPITVYHLPQPCVPKFEGCQGWWGK